MPTVLTTMSPWADATPVSGRLAARISTIYRSTRLFGPFSRALWCEAGARTARAARRTVGEAGGTCGAAGEMMQAAHKALVQAIWSSRDLDTIVVR
jgi:hypothetical protein